MALTPEERRQRKAYVAEHGLPPGIHHGYAAYTSWLCRCEVCTQANRDYGSAYRARKAQEALRATEESIPTTDTQKWAFAVTAAFQRLLRDTYTAAEIAEAVEGVTEAEVEARLTQKLSRVEFDREMKRAYAITMQAVRSKPSKYWLNKFPAPEPSVLDLEQLYALPSAAEHFPQ